MTPPTTFEIRQRFLRLHDKKLTVQEMEARLRLSYPTLYKLHEFFGLIPHVNWRDARKDTLAERRNLRRAEELARIQAEAERENVANDAVEEPAPKHLPPGAALDPIGFAKAELRDRFEDKGTHWLLDGAPCDLDRLMTEINRKVKAEGYAGHVGKNPAWHGR